VACIALVVLRILSTGDVLYTSRIRYGLLWNLFLAWLPLLFALWACGEYQRPPQRRRMWFFWTMGFVWLLFYPNAPYICTDLIHLTARIQHDYWVDLVIVLMCALTGLVLGFVSLFLMQSAMADICGRPASWVFVALVAYLSGFGIYLGRFLRFNSWDVISKPFELYQGIGSWMTSPETPTGMLIPLLFAAFVLVTYIMLYALTLLREVRTEHVFPPERTQADPAPKSPQI
jgi:uncharacterized membrane protein